MAAHKTLESFGVVMPRTKVLKMLHKHGVPWKTFGIPPARSLDDLFMYHERDCFNFRNGSAKTCIVDVYVAVVLVVHRFNRKWYELYEEKQVFTNGEVLVRDNFNGIAETIKRGESLREGATRCLGEELCFRNPAKYELSECLGIEHREPIPSEKFPGIMAAYHRHVFECTISRALYCPDGYAEQEGNKTVYFKWKPCHQLGFRI